MAAASPSFPGADYQEELRVLREENQELRERIEYIETNYSSQISLALKRIAMLEGARQIDSKALNNHLSALITWLETHPERKGITYSEAAKLLNVTKERISQIRPAVESHDRLCIAKSRGKHREKYISFR